MVDGVAKGVGEQLGQLGKQIVTEVAKTPAKIVGLDETLGSSGSSKSQQTNKTQRPAAQEKVKPMQELAQKDEVEKQKQLAQARRLLQQFAELQKEEPSVKEKLELEELEKKKKEIEEEKKKAKQVLVQPQAKQARGDLYGVKGKQFGGEVGKNVKTG